MSRKLKTLLPMFPSKLEEVVNARKSFINTEEKRKTLQENNYNRRHNSKEMSDLKISDTVWITDLRKYGVVSEVCSEPRAYIVKTNDGTVYRRNRWFLIAAPYYVPNANNVTPLPIVRANYSENPKDSSSGEKIVESDSVQCSDKPISISESAEALPSSVAPSASENITPKRNKKRPNWFSDYIT
ncbi:uncharacterized protein LOC126878968 [Diabrotica virgifera virgifera]|uniref:Uncharacterized protein n=1 Tax=Diabrotica virgifera virgifera TaxID=50390 RepID=A0ABM5JIN7_DIAVI|nr:uncharacterized protein LOC126878968 [Diabrotica virgifera virgifera]